jgi:hypothetical protein
MLTKERKQKGTKMLVLQLGLIPLNDYFLDLFIGTLTPWCAMMSCLPSTSNKWSILWFFNGRPFVLENKRDTK